MMGFILPKNIKYLNMLVKYNVTEMKHTFNRSFPCISYLFNIAAVFIKHERG